MPIERIYESCLALTKHGWILDTITMSRCVYRGKRIAFPIIALRTPTAGPRTLWLLAGVHGEEPAGPNAIASPKALTALRRLGERMPIVLLPLCNPTGYLRNWRYLNRATWDSRRPGKSVGDAEHVLPIVQPHATKPRSARPSSREAAQFAQYVIDTTKTYRPRLSVDLHEDNLLTKGYVYAQGRSNQRRGVAQRIVRILQRTDIPMQLHGQTRFGEQIDRGVVGNVHDASVDELLASPRVLMDSTVITKPAAPISLVVETPANALPLHQRVRAHQTVVTSLESLL